MHRKIDWLAKRDTLRATAEALLPDFGKVFPDKSPTEILMNELLIHKVELEVQIDELKRSNLAMEESRDRYLDLYDHSPVGFITLNRDGVMTELNLRASVLLGIDRLNMTLDRFSTHIAINDTDKWNLFFLKLMEQNASDPESLTLSLLGADMATFTVHIYCQRMKTADQISMLRLTLISDRKLGMND
jgi:PAS domain-containing protein